MTIREENELIKEFGELLKDYDETKRRQGYLHDVDYDIIVHNYAEKIVERIKELIDDINKQARGVG